MILKTRYRDIPFEEALKCAAPGSPDWTRERWEFWKGRTFSVIAPPCDPRRALGVFSCEGPFYVGVDHPEYAVCPHIAEIGD